VEAGLKVAVTPAGIPVAESATVPAKPPAGTTEIVLGALDAPCTTLRLAGAAVMV
jgi:antitoxin (DNA-binding transcriptional repressor) of toxin-antitoxin stability system